jgi:hypothetical protein
VRHPRRGRAPKFKPARRRWVPSRVPPDITAPDTSITAGPADPTTSTTASFTLEATETDCTFEVRLDGGSWVAASGTPSNVGGTTVCTHDASGLSSAAHTLEARATDASLNTDASPTAHDWAVEAAPEPVESVNVLRYPVQTQGKCTIRLLSLDGVWETVGADRCRGVRHEGLTASANRMGSDTCRFTLKRQPGGVFPDLTAFTPIEIINPFGTLVWTGRIKETPSSDGDEFSIGVEGQGWQYHLDDDVYERTYVHARLSDWKDYRSSLDADLTHFTTVGRVESGDGAIVLGYPEGGGVVQAVTRCGVYLDLGPDSTAKRVVTEFENVATAGGAWTLFCKGADTAAELNSGLGETLWTRDPSFGSATDAFTFAAQYRFILIGMLRADVSTTLAADQTVRIRSAKVFRDPAYESGNASVLRAHHVIKDALPFAPLLSQDTSLIQDTSFNIPDMAATDDRKPREMMDAVNVLHNYKLKVREDLRLEFGPLPTVPKFRVGAWSGADFKDASKNSGDEIFNRDLVKGTGADGGPLKISRLAPRDALAAAQPTNPGFEIDTSDWSVAAGTLTRDTTVFASGVASGRVTSNVAGSFRLNPNQLVAAARPGRHYEMRVRLRRTSAVSEIRVRTEGADVLLSASEVSTSGFTEIAIPFVALTTGPTLTVSQGRAPATPSTTVLYIDEVQLWEGSTLVDRRGFTRTHVDAMSQALVTDVGQQIADTFLATHRRTPLKGDITAKGRGGVRRWLGDASVPPSELLIHTGEIVHLANQVDPDTGALGRDAPMDSVTWGEDEDTASVTLDAQRDNLAALVARYALVGGGA